LNVEFIVVEPVSEETSTNPDPRKRVIENAEVKVRSISDRFPDALIIGADTVVFKEGEFLGKPISPDMAVMMLEMLSGSIHSVFTGVVVLDVSSNRLVSGADETRVKFKILDSQTIRDYVSSDEPMDKAGAYAIQGGASSFVEWIDGSRSNVIGLSLELLTELLSKLLS
ncbi:MAG: Maf family protein, partial [Candidatus Bathyarchaeota archaeon]|nr:Maf family protein [Candidatus Bathyarchaeota archaeon]